MECDSVHFLASLTQKAKIDTWRDLRFESQETSKERFLEEDMLSNVLFCIMPFEELLVHLTAFR